MAFSADRAAWAEAWAGPMDQEDVRHIRGALGVTQQALAEMLGTGRRTVWRWETGGPIPGTARIALRALVYILVPDFEFGRGLTGPR